MRDTRTVCGVWKERAEAIAELPEPEVPDRSLNYQRAGDGTLLGRFVFDPALAAEFEKALDTAITWEGADDLGHERCGGQTVDGERVPSSAVEPRPPGRR